MGVDWGAIWAWAIVQLATPKTLGLLCSTNIPRPHPQPGTGRAGPTPASEDDPMPWELHMDQLMSDLHGLQQPYWAHQDP